MGALPKLLGDERGSDRAHRLPRYFANRRGLLPAAQRQRVDVRAAHRRKAFADIGFRRGILDEDRYRCEPVRIDEMPYGSIGTCDLALGRDGKLEARRRRGAPWDLGGEGFGFRCALHREARRVDRRLERRRGNVRGELDVREQYLLDDVALLVDKMRFQRHRGRKIEPEHIAVTVFVARLDFEELDRAVGDAGSGPELDLVVRLELGRVARQRRSERADVAAGFEQHDASIREDSLNARTLADDLAARAVERQNPFPALAARMAMNDVQSFRRAVEHMHERAAV